MILIPGQKKKIEENLKRLQNKKNQNFSYFKERNSFGHDAANIIVGDMQTEIEHQKLIMEIKEHNYVLENVDEVSYIPSDKIGIGTKFILSFEDDDEQLEFTLCDNLFCLQNSQGYISKDNPIGKQLLNKKEGDIIEHNGLKIKIEKITSKEQLKETRQLDDNSIKKEITNSDLENNSHRSIDIKTDADRMIRNRSKQSRICKEAAKKRKEILKFNDLKAYEEITSISESQLQLLKKEKLYVIKQLKNNNISTSTKKSLVKRLSNINKLIKESKQASLPTDNTIGIGTQFSMMIISYDEDVKFERRELINSAVTIETDDMYIERISPLGSKLYGLSENEEINYRKDNNNNYASVIVYDIDNAKERFVTNDPTEYARQKAKIKKI